ncbi:MAG: hypothetical protein NT007_08050 [Candidatus Kapabacteria bacterium]|nr:hypothetical protein [Candidatus Kapabacteria bacterium]
MNNWNLIIPPSRPSERQLELLKELTACIDRRLNVAILGSTIEFRDLLYELNFQNIYVFERNEDFYNLSKKQRIYNNEEIFVQGDWLETLEKYPNHFALIVSDLTSGNISYIHRKKFYLDIENALLNEGHFFDKVLTHSNNFLSIDKLLNKYKTLPLNLVTINYFNCEMLFCSELLMEKEIVNTDYFFRKLESLTTNQRILRLIELVKLITPPGFIWFYGKHWIELQSDYCKNLIKISEYEDEIQSPYYGFLKFFHFKK